MRKILFIVIAFLLSILFYSDLFSCGYENCIKEKMKNIKSTEVPKQIIRFCKAKCTNYAKAEIENDILINPEYNISIKIPQGWKFSEKSPEKVNKAFKNGLRMMVLFLSHKNEGIPDSRILVQCKKYFRPINEFINEEFWDGLQQYLETESKNFNFPNNNNYNFQLFRRPYGEVAKDGKGSGSAEFIRLNEKNIIDQRKPIKKYIKSITYAYPCEQGMDSTCILTFEVTSVDSLFDRDKKVMEEIISSKQWMHTE
jgi:hypothetical protein